MFICKIIILCMCAVYIRIYEYNAWFCSLQTPLHRAAVGICVQVCVCARAYVCAYVCACVCVHVRYIQL